MTKDERRNVWKVVESQELYDAIMKMNELDRLSRTAGHNGFGFSTELNNGKTRKPTTPAPIQWEDDAIKQVNKKGEMEEFFSKTDNGGKYDLSVAQGVQLDSLTESFVKLDKNELVNYSEDKLEQLDSLTESFVMLNKDELENYSATHDSFI